MALSAAEALARNVAQTFSVSVTTASLNSYAASDGTPSAVTADGSAATNTVELVRDRFGVIHGIRANAGAVLSKRCLLSASQVFEFLFEGVGGTGDTEVGSPEV